MYDILYKNIIKYSRVRVPGQTAIFLGNGRLLLDSLWATSGAVTVGVGDVVQNVRRETIAFRCVSSDDQCPERQSTATAGGTCCRINVLHGINRLGRTERLCENNVRCTNELGGKTKRIKKKV